MASKVKYTPTESGSLGLGSAGSQVTAAAAITGTFCAITALSDTTFTTLTAEESAHPSTSDFSGITLPAGVTIYGRWTEIDTATGVIIAYNG